MKQDAEKWEIDGECPKIVMSRDMMNKLFAYATLAKGEISGLGEVEVKDGEIRVVDTCLLKQECGGATTDIDPDDLAKWNLEMIQAGKDTQRWRLWWHSHADMGVFFSGTDSTCAKDLLNCFGDFVVSVVVNRKGEVYGRINYNLPPQGVFSKFAIVCEHCPVVIEDISTLDIEAMKAEIAEKVSEHTHVISHAVGGYGGSTYGSDYSVEPAKSGHWDSTRQEYVHDKRSDLIWSVEHKRWGRDPKWTKGEGLNQDLLPLGETLTTPNSQAVAIKCEGCGNFAKTKLHYPSDNYLCKKCRREWAYSMNNRGGYYGC
jgi:hypothetical protein